MRILAAGAGASVQAVGAGTLADIYIPQERGKAMGWFYLGPLTGPLIVEPKVMALTVGTDNRWSAERTIRLALDIVVFSL